MNWLDIVIIVCIIIGVVHGLITGIVKQVISLVALVAAILLSGAVANWIRQWIQPYIQGENPDVQNVIYYVLAFIIIISIFAVLANLVDKIINFTPAGIINKFFGAFFGMFMWTLCLSILLNILAVFDTESQLISQQVKESSVFYDRVNRLFPTVFPYIQDFFKR